MSRPEQRRTITDVRALAAVAHPVRVALLNQLMAYGPRTASQCADAVGASASACSYHLRQLARWGFVEPAPADDGRERPWQATATGFALDPDLGDPAALAMQQTLAGMQVDQDAELAHAFLRRADSVGQEWLDATELSRFSLLMTPDELAALTAALDALIRPYIGLTRTDPPAGAKPVHLDLNAFPLPEEQA
ncbi:MAG TPA: winged helix-turn-helix domain-containing protein [Mycobacteriales bacterium]|nr:winged helix-turn-helix domain-containing protein [Mycobacteriales bacterium]